MALINPLMFSAEDYKIQIFFENKAFFFIQTAITIGMKNSVDAEDIMAIGQTAPIATKKNGEKFSGTIEFQVGELIALLLAAGVTTAIRINNATIAIIGLNSAAIPFSRTYMGVNINTENFDIKAKATNTTVSCDFTAVNML